MKTKRIISSLLVLAMLVGSLVYVVPIGASAADAPPYEEVTNAAMSQAYTSLAEKLADQLSSGYMYLAAQTTGYELYVGKYTGEIILKNRLTGELLGSNPYNLGSGLSASNKQELLSQVWITFLDANQQSFIYNSFAYAAQKGQIYIDLIRNGVRIEYTMGDTTTRYLLPVAIAEDDFRELYLIPAQQTVLRDYAELYYSFLMDPSLVRVTDATPAHSEYTDLEGNPCTLEYGNEESVQHFLETMLYYPEESLGDITTFDQYNNPRGGVGYSKLMQYYMLGSANSRFPANNTAISRQISNVYDKGYGTLIYTGYRATLDLNTITNQDSLNSYLEDYPGLAQYTAENPFAEGQIYPIVYLLGDLSISGKASIQNEVLYLNPELTMDEVLACEERLGVEVLVEVTPVFRLALEYVLTDTGVEVTLPASSVSFDETTYTLQNIQFLKYMGSASKKQDGYIFYPDGSGALINFSDFTNTELSAPVYGYDSAYRNFEQAAAHSETIRMPVYGLVGTDESGTRFGYLAIMTEGEALVRLQAQIFAAYDYVGVWQSVVLRPSDIYTMTGADKEITVYSKQRYMGNYTTRYVMLSDPAVVDLVNATNLDGFRITDYYETSYVGMAAAYREYLVEQGVLSKLNADEIGTDLPLYIEVFGKTETTEKIFSIPVEVDVALTTFKDIETMYEELAGSGISNIKFKLTGFANDGVIGTYPVKVKWEKVVGGKSGFEDLLTYVENNADRGIEVFPDFDFMYLTYTPAFDGVSTRKIVGRALDNRYAILYTYDSVYQMEIPYSYAVSVDMIPSLFAKFTKKYNKFGADSISVSSMAGGLSSDFDQDKYYDRQEALYAMQGILQTVSDTYSNVLSDGGNIYALKYIDHLLEAPIDSSHYRGASRTIPFFGMVVHGYLSYTGDVFNQSGEPDYMLLRSIESGASLYFLLSYQNLDVMKENYLSQYYSVNYHTWKEDLLETYKELNAAIGDLQLCEITGHEFLIGERVITEAESIANIAALEAEFLQQTEAAMIAARSAKAAVLRAVRTFVYTYADMQAAGATAEELDAYAAEQLAALDAADLAAIEAATGQTGLAACQALVADESLMTVHSVADYDALMADAAERLGQAPSQELADSVRVLCEAYANDSGTLTAEIGALDYETQYHYVTSSDSQSGAAYETTDYTLADGSIVLVTYSDGTHLYRFLLNYNTFSVRLNFGGETIELPAIGYQRLETITK